MTPTLTDEHLGSVFSTLREANRGFIAAYPGDTGARQPVHTVYGGAHLFKATTAGSMGRVALRHLEAYAPTPAAFAEAFGLQDADLAKTVYHRVVEKLKREAVEDFRIDFEDGYGNRPDAEEDAEAVRTAEEVAQGMTDNSLPPFIGIRIKPFSQELMRRSVRTLDLFISTLAKHTRGSLPEHFVVTLPKVSLPAQVRALVALFEQLEAQTTLEQDSLRLEIMVETPQALIDQRGEVALPALVAAADRRCVAAHFGVYDYTASCDITAAYQHMTHPACDFARQVMKVSLGGTGIWLSDGATNIMPVGPHRATEGADLTETQHAENRAVVHRAWKRCYGDIRHSLVTGYYQGWDLHPAQLTARYAAVYTFFLESLEAASKRLHTFVGKAAQATLVGDVFDDAATGQALLNYFLRALNCGAITEDEVQATGLTIDEIQSRSFYQILENRRTAS